MNDVDDDGDNEIVVGADNRIASLKWNASATYEELDRIYVASNLQWYGIVVGDVDYDGVNELIAGNVNGELHVFEWNIGLGGLAEEWSADIGDNAWKIAIGDADNDGQFAPAQALLDIHCLAGTLGKAGGQFRIGKC